MENINYVISELKRGRGIFANIFSDIPEEAYIWKQNPDKWSLLEILCHLYDEEREDFRARVMSALENPLAPLKPIDPVGWVKSRNYAGKEFKEMLDLFLNERDRSVEYLESLDNPVWTNAINHPKRGKISAESFFVNWLAHDYLHTRQIVKLKYDYLKHISGDPLDYAGEW